MHTYIVGSTTSEIICAKSVFEVDDDDRQCNDKIKYIVKMKKC